MESKVWNLSELTNYQDGTIVSRTILKKNKGTITIFAFDKGESLSEHTAPFEALVTVLDGTVEVLIDGKPFHVKKDQAILLPANVPHAIKGKEKFKMMLTMIRE